MIDLKELDKTINYLNELKKKEEEKQLDTVKDNIRKEIIKDLDKVLLHFESQALVNFRDETNRQICFEYNYNELIDSVIAVLKVDVWEVE